MRSVQAFADVIEQGLRDLGQDVSQMRLPSDGTPAPGSLLHLQAADIISEPTSHGGPDPFQQSSEQEARSVLFLEMGEKGRRAFQDSLPRRGNRQGRG